MPEGKFYWLKLRKDFFKRHDVRILENMPGGKEILLFYLKLMCESLDHNGALRYSCDTPYTDEMLAVVLNTKVSTVKRAMLTLTSLEMVVIDEEKTIKIPGVEGLIGSASNTDTARRVREFRKRQKNTATVTECNANVTSTVTECNNVIPTVTKCNESKNKSKNKSKEIDIKETAKAVKKSAVRFIPPTVGEVDEYCLERNNGIDPQEFIDYYETSGWKRKGNVPIKDWKACVRTWEKFERKNGKPNKKKTPADELNEFYDMTAEWVAEEENHE